jgi:hypothetical protein
MEIDVKTLASELMLKAIDQAKRDELLRGALAYIIDPRPPAPGSFSSRSTPSVLQEAFHTAISNEVNKMVSEEVKSNPEIRRQLEESVRAGFVKFFACLSGSHTPQKR